MKDNENRRPMPQAEADGIIEGRNAVIEALRAGTAIDKIYLAKGETDKTLGHIASRAREKGIVVVEADRRKLDGMSRTHAHQGVIALAAMLEYVSVQSLLDAAAEKGEAPLLVVWSYHFGPVEYVALLVVGLLGAAVLASGGMVRALAMVLLGMLLGLSGTDGHTGETRFVGDWPQWRDGFGFGALALGLLAVAPLITHLHQTVSDPVVPQASEPDTWPTRADWRAVLPALWRGSALGLMLGVFPGGGALLSSWVAYALERVVSSGAQPALGQGQPRGVVAPEAASSAGAQTAFLPTLALGLPANAVMAVVLGVLVQHHIEPGPQLMGVQPELFLSLTPECGHIDMPDPWYTGSYDLTVSLCEAAADALIARLAKG